MSKRVTIKTIATDLGISHMTVSRALSEHPNVNAKTRELVRNRAEELGYVRSAAASAMRGDLSPIVGLVIPNITNDFYAHFANKMAESCEEHALQLIIHLTKDDFEAERRAINKLRELQARAVALVPAPLSATDRDVAISGLDVVELIRQRDQSRSTPAVLVDDDAAFRQAVHQLHSQGHARIAYLGAPETLSSGQARLHAFQQGLMECGLENDPSLVFTAPPSLEMGEENARTVIKQTDATAMLCGGFEISNGALKACIDLDALNSGMSFIGYGDPPFYSWVQGGISTIKVPVDELAIRTVELVRRGFERMSKTDHPFEAKLIIRNT